MGRNLSQFSIPNFQESVANERGARVTLSPDAARSLAPAPVRLPSVEFDENT